MANIITDLGSGDMAVRMTNARFARQPLPAIFSGWTTLRVALYCRMLDSGANITGTVRFGFGLCSGDTDILGDSTTTNFCGMISNFNGWTRATAAIRYTIGSGIVGTSAWSPATRVSSTLTTVATGFVTGGSSSIHTTAPAMYFVDITVGSPNYSLLSFYYANSATAPTPTLSDFLQQSLQTTPSFTNHTRPATPVTIAVDEATNGTLNHSCVWWDQAAASIDVVAWRVYRLV